MGKYSPKHHVCATKSGLHPYHIVIGGDCGSMVSSGENYRVLGDERLVDVGITRMMASSFGVRNTGIS